MSPWAVVAIMLIDWLIVTAALLWLGGRMTTHRPVTDNSTYPK